MKENKGFDYSERRESYEFDLNDDLLSDEMDSMSFMIGEDMNHNSNFKKSNQPERLRLPKAPKFIQQEQGIHKFELRDSIECEGLFEGKAISDIEPDNLLLPSDNNQEVYYYDKESPIHRMMDRSSIVENMERKVDSSDLNLEGLYNLRLQYKRSYSKKFKDLVVKYAAKFGMRKASRDLKLSTRNINRWINNGADQTKRGGRKISDPLIDHEMIKWVDDYIKYVKFLPKQSEIIQKAKSFSSDKFKASRGWCHKFIKRNKPHFLTML